MEVQDFANVACEEIGASADKGGHGVTSAAFG